MSLKGKKVAFLVAEGVEDLEFYAVAMRLEEEGIEILTAAMNLDPIRGKNGLVIKPDTLIVVLKLMTCSVWSCPAAGRQTNYADTKKPPT